MNAILSVQNIIAGLGQPSKGGGLSGEFIVADSAFKQFRSAVDAGIIADDQEAERFWTEIRRLFQHGWNFAAERDRFIQQSNALKQGANRVLTAVGNVWESWFVPKGGATNTLATDATRWRLLAQRVRQMEQDGKRLQHLNGWEGNSADSYAQAVQVQIGAMKELAGVMDALGDSCTRGREGNLLLLTSLHSGFKTGVDLVGNTRSTDGNSYYLKTAAAWRAGADILKNLYEVAQGSTQEGMAEGLVAYIEDTLSSLNLLELGAWVTGTAAAGTIPADFEPLAGGVPGVSVPSGPATRGPSGVDL